ncbi:MAG: tetratricopeptide repeat protein [Burkholderiaceae bacterium]|nr:tetratricopeptide repeat protein [Pseudomonadota bacterium]MBS0597757.1 tetratricopeptide repeat protein [Pseudomonadota bacterium]MCO5115890.1 tetratricopeptide repeat protein [Burkholderiaceae bacterium]MCP5219081.1 tetratricopeptide repeat protein [Burkholderiaceae bacterium]
MPYPAPVLVCSTLALAALIGCAPQAPAAAPAAAQVATSSSPPASPASAPPQAEATPKAVAGAPVQSGLTARLMYELLVGEMSFDLGDPQQGTAYLLDAARRADDETVYQRATDMAIQSRAGPAALEAVRAWRQAFPQSLQATRYELQVLLALGRVSETAKPVKTLLDALPAAEKVSFIAALPALYQRVASKDEALQAVETALADALKDPALAPAAWTTVGRLRLQQGDRTGALVAATLGLDAGPESQWPALLALQLFSGTGENQAEPLIKRYLAGAQAKPEIQLDYVRALLERGRRADAKTELTSLVARWPQYPDGWLLQGLLAADDRHDNPAEQSLKHYLDLLDKEAEQPGDVRAAGRNQAELTLARIAARRGDDAGAKKWLDRIDSPEQLLAAQVERANLLARQGRLDEARQAIQAVPEREPDDARSKLLAETQLLRENGQAQQALRLLNVALKQSPDDDALLYDAAMAAERLDRTDEMERLLRRVIKLKPDSAQAYNALGYSLADRGVRLPEARTLIEKAVQLAPDDAYIQDSLGWAEFRQGQLGRAQRTLQAAFDKRPDPEIAAHLGEVLWALGERDSALSTWREGLRLDPRNPTLNKTLKRLQVTP